MDSERVEVIGGEKGAGDGDEDRRVEELLRVNARLAAEVRTLSLARAEGPRPGSMTAPRRLAMLIEERETLAKHLADAQTAVEHREAAIEHREAEIELGRAHREELERVNADLNDVITRLRSGPRGVLRRLFARLSRLLSR